MDKQLDSKRSISLFFDVCAKIEGVCAELYHYYGVIHRDNEDVSRLWIKTALEEENHQNQFKLAYRLRNDVEFELESDLARADRIYQKLIKLLEHVRRHPPDIITALTKAIEMEESLADLHVENAVRFTDQATQKMFKALGEFDQDHVKSLRHSLAIVTLSQSEMVG